MKIFFFSFRVLNDVCLDHFRVLRAGEVKVSRDVPCTFKVVYVLDEKGKVHYFGAMNEAEMIVSSA